MILLSVVLFLAFAVSLGVGRYWIPVWDVLRALLGIGESEPVVLTVLYQIRLPRIIAAILVGAALSVAGTSFQGMFKNPLVSSYTLGVSSGAGLGAAIAILISGDAALIQLFAFIGSVVAVGITYGLSRMYKGTSNLTLVLAGIIISSFFSAIISLIQYVADPTEKLPAIVFWLMGSLSSVTQKDVLVVAPIIIIVGVACLMAVRWRINLLSMGEEEAQSMGVDLRLTVGIIVLCSTLITAAAVSVSGVIGWIGLVIPHIGRMLVGPDNRKLLPVTALLGAAYLLVIDDLSRTLTTGEVPVGILTALIGTPFFAYLLWRSKGAWD
jgi:iron complex transport system permease protein